jgi:hypothetical protein
LDFIVRRAGNWNEDKTVNTINFKQISIQLTLQALYAFFYVVRIPEMLG